MFFPLMFINPPLYWFMYVGATMRHVGMPYHQHRMLMRMFYGM